MTESKFSFFLLIKKIEVWGKVKTKRQTKIEDLQVVFLFLKVWTLTVNIELGLLGSKDN